MFSKFELVGASISVGLMAFAIYLVQAESIMFRGVNVEQTSQAISSQQSGIVIVGQSANVNQARTDALLSAVDSKGNLNNMVIDDVKFGTGETVKDGDTVSVHYVGTLQDGEEFDNSRKRGAAFDFKVGAGMVIKGWDEGVVGMQIGGQRILVIPPEMAYGDKGIGPIPGGATLVFAIELLEIK
ncbi:MAG: FKBP-type peptidyl-prolyl cis-trans isomerase [Candidatus Pacebacteria bacterium]|nr:FKBP-type peptidyl-prolyl cis-trans isomerase [Candidatus Paceibacterota bacterium]